MAITFEMNQKIQSLQIIDIYIYVCMYVCMCVCVCVCDYINSDVKTSKMLKKIYN